MLHRVSLRHQTRSPSASRGVVVFRRARIGKISYVIIAVSLDPSTPQDIGDSTLITRTLVHGGLLVGLDVRLPPTEKLNDLAPKALLGDKLYFYQGDLRGPS